jgi:general secretion pathway protein I
MTPRRPAAFTILEVLISLAIFALAAVVLGGAYVNVLNGYEAANRLVSSDQDVRFARAALLTETDPEVVAKGGEFDSADQHHVTWKATLQPTLTADLFDVLFECDIAGGDLRKPMHVKETFRLLRPTWSKDADRNKLRADAAERINKLLKLAP